MTDNLQSQVEKIRQQEQSELAKAWAKEENRAWQPWMKKVWRWSGAVALVAVGLAWCWYAAWLKDQRQNCFNRCEKNNLISTETEVDCHAQCDKYQK